MSKYDGTHDLFEDTRELRHDEHKRYQSLSSFQCYVPREGWTSLQQCCIDYRDL